MPFTPHGDATRFAWSDDLASDDVAQELPNSGTTGSATGDPGLNLSIDDPWPGLQAPPEAWGGSLPASHPDVASRLIEVGGGTAAPSPWAVAIPQPQMLTPAPVLVQHALQPTHWVRERVASPQAQTLLIRPPSWRDGVVGLLIGLVALALPVSGAIAWGMKSDQPAPVAAAAAPVTTAAPIGGTAPVGTVDPNAAGGFAPQGTGAPFGTAPSNGAGAASGAAGRRQPGSGTNGSSQNGAGRAPGARPASPPSIGGSVPSRPQGGAGSQQAQGGGGVDPRVAAAQQQANQQAAAHQQQHQGGGQQASRPQAQQPAPQAQPSYRKPVAWTATSVASGHTWDMPPGQDAQIKDNPAFTIRPKYEDGSLGQPLPAGQSIPT